MPENKPLFDVSPINAQDASKQGAEPPPTSGRPETAEIDGRKPERNREAPKAVETAPAAVVSHAETRRRQALADRSDGTLARDRARRIKKGGAPLLRDLAAVDMTRRPTPAELEIIAPANMMPLETLADCESWGAVVARVLSFKALLGQIPAIQEIHDRLDPKVQRIDADVAARPMAPHGDNEAENAAAAAYFEELDE